MSKIELPPLPEPAGVIVVNTQALRAFAASQLHARDRQIVELCASIVRSANNYDNPMTANDCADAILALLGDKGEA